MIIQVQHGQNLIDVAIQHYGSAASLVELAQANNLALDADLQPGQTLSLPESETAIAVFADYLKESGKKVISGETPGTIEILITNDGESLDGLQI